MNTEEKIKIYFTGYSTSSDYSINDYFKVLEEYRTKGELHKAIYRLRKNY